MLYTKFISISESLRNNFKPLNQGILIKPALIENQIYENDEYEDVPFYGIIEEVAPDYTGFLKIGDKCIFVARANLKDNLHKYFIVYEHCLLGRCCI